MTGPLVVHLSPEQKDWLKAQVIAKRKAALRAARSDGAAFNAYVLRDEETGKAIAMCRMHRDWHDLIDEHPRCIVWSHVEAGKTSQIAVGRVLFELGKDTSKRIVVLSKTQGQAVKIIRSIATYIERSPELKEVFPNLFPSVPWTSTALMVQREVFSKDFSVQAYGIGGNVIGARIDTLIVDDILDWKNTRTPSQRAELIRWFKSEFVGRLTSDSRVIVCGNAYHPEDFLHMLAREGYVAKTYAVRAIDGSIRFPRKWTADRIAKKRIELGPAEAARQLDCVARKDSDVRCREEWVRKCLARGEGLTLLRSLEEADFVDGSRAYTGVDIGVGKKKQNAKTVIFTILVQANGDVRLAGIDSGRWSGLEIVQRAVDHHVRYKSVVFVEDNGAQAHLLDFAKDVKVDGEVVASLSMCIVPHNTGNNKTHPVIGVESLFAEFELGRWIIPCEEALDRPGHFTTTETINEWLAECENYDPERHTGDHLMAAWIARHGSRLGRHAAAPQGPVASIVGDVDADRARRRAENPEHAAELEGWEGAMRRDR